MRNAKSGFLRTAAMMISVVLAACGGSDGEGDMATADAPEALPQTMAVELWSQGSPAFGIFVPDERPREEMRAPDGSRRPPIHTADAAAVLGANPLLDYLFLNLEPGYDGEAVRATLEGLARDPANRTTLLVRIPPISSDGPETTRENILDLFAAGAHGVVLPHVRSVEEGEMAIGFFAEAGVDLWTPDNRTGDRVAMMMIEDPGALAVAEQIADLDGYSMLACGIGSLTRALDNDRAAAEAGNLEVLAQATRRGMPDMITANATDVEQRLEEGFLGLLMSGPEADDAIRIGRTAAGR